MHKEAFIYTIIQWTFILTVPTIGFIPSNVWGNSSACVTTTDSFRPGQEGDYSLKGEKSPLSTPSGSEITSIFRSGCVEKSISYSYKTREEEEVECPDDASDDKTCTDIDIETESGSTNVRGFRTRLSGREVINIPSDAFSVSTRSNCLEPAYTYTYCPVAPTIDANFSPDKGKSINALAGEKIPIEYTTNETSFNQLDVSITGDNIGGRENENLSKGSISQGSPFEKLVIRSGSQRSQRVYQKKDVPDFVKNSPSFQTAVPRGKGYNTYIPPSGDNISSAAKFGTKSITIKVTNGLGEVRKETLTATLYPEVKIGKFNVKAARGPIPNREAQENFVTSNRKVNILSGSTENQFGTSCTLSGPSDSGFETKTNGILQDTPSYDGSSIPQKLTYTKSCSNPVSSDSATDTINVVPEPKLNLQTSRELKNSSQKANIVKENPAIIGNGKNPVTLRWKSKNTTIKPDKNPNPCNVNNVSWTDKTKANGSDIDIINHKAQGGTATSITQKQYSFTCKNWLNVIATDKTSATSLPPLKASCSAFPKRVDNDAQSIMTVNIKSRTSGKNWDYSPFDYLFDRDFNGSFSTDEDKDGIEGKRNFTKTQIREPLNYEFEKVGNRKPKVEISTDFQQGDKEQDSCGNITNFRLRRIREVQP